MPAPHLRDLMQMFGAGQIQNNMLNGYQEMLARSMEFSGKRWFADILDESVSNPDPELFGGNPYTAAPTHNPG